MALSSERCEEIRKRFQSCGFPSFQAVAAAASRQAGRPLSRELVSQSLRGVWPARPTVAACAALIGETPETLLPELYPPAVPLAI